MLVCLCKAVTERELRALARQGARTLEDVARETHAGSDCGACKGQIQAILDEEYAARVESASSAPAGPGHGRSASGGNAPRGQ